MLKDDLVYLNHMLDMVRKAIGKVTIKSHADSDADEDLRMVLAHLVQIERHRSSPVQGIR